MTGRCHWGWASLVRRFSVTGTIVVCTGALVLAGSPQLHERIHHQRARLIHSCGLTLARAGKCTPAIENRARLLVCRTPAAILPAPRTILIPRLRSEAFLEACRWKHGPPALS